MSSYRVPNIKGEIEPFLQRLYELYEETDPAKGDTSEVEKYEAARRAIQIWWTIFGRLLLWAQAQLTGDALVHSDPRLRAWLEAREGEEIQRGSHILELVGLSLPFNLPPGCEDEIAKLSDELSQNDFGLDENSLRLLVRALVRSTDANTSFWRFPLGDALHRLEYGQIDDLLKPAKLGARGQAGDLAFWKAVAVAHVYHLEGSGMTKIKAQELVGHSIGQAVETLRTWEKELKGDDTFYELWVSAWEAGIAEFESRRTGSTTGIRWQVGDWSYAVVKDRIRRLREK
jgi:hypothetical protein